MPSNQRFQRTVPLRGTSLAALGAAEPVRLGSNGNRLMWDVFISHASEDKAAVAAPLANELRNHCLSVWLDKWVLSPGDSLRRKIDDGISKSRLGVVVLSRAFFAKAWPQAKLDALYTLAVSGKRSVVPVWHEVTADEVMDFSPLLAALLALPTTRGIETIAGEIAVKIGCKGQPLTVEVGAGPLAVVPSVAALAAAIRQSEDIPGSSPHDFVGLALLEHAVLVNPRGMGERIGANGRLVRLHRKTGHGPYRRYDSGWTSAPCPNREWACAGCGSTRRTAPNCVTHRVGDIDGRRAFANHRFENAAEEVDVGPASVFRIRQSGL